MIPLSDRVLSAGRRYAGNGLIANLAAWLLATPARAAPELTVALDYEIAPILQGCPGETEFRNKIVAQLGYDPFRHDSAMRVVVRAAPTERGTEGQVEWQDPAGKANGDRQFVTGNRECVRLVAEMSFAVAVQIQLLGAIGVPPPDRASSRSETSPRSNSATPPSVPPGRDPTSPQLPLPPHPSGGSIVETMPQTWSLFAGVGPAAALGLAPTPTMNARLFVALRVSRASVEFGVDASLPATERQPDGSGFRQDGMATALGFCGHVDRFALCGLARVGEVWVHGFGVDKPAAASGLVAHLGARLTATQPLGPRFSASLRADGLVLLAPWTVDLNHTGVWTMPRLAGLIGFDLAARFR